jgi:hypothetical protein
MKIIPKNRQVIGLITLIFSLAKPAIAMPAIELGGDKSFQNREITSGSIKVLVTYRPFNLGDSNRENDKNVTYKIFYNGKLKVNGSDFTMMTGSVSLQDLDNNQTPEVIINTYSGGAHCCTNLTIYTWIKNKFIKEETGLLNSGGGEFKDLDGDGKLEFVTVDNAFLYRFSSYAGSFPPSLIYTLKNGRLENVTRKYPKELKLIAEEMYKAVLENRKEKSEINGILAGYVAQKILLGEYQQAWDFMLKNYDKKSDWGLEIYKNDTVVGKYPDFPTALKAFLIEQKYLPLRI